MKKYLWLSLAGLIIAFIWGNSLQPAVESESLSVFWANLVKSIFLVFHVDVSIGVLDHIVRKLAHFTEFFVQGFLLYKSLSMFKVRHGVRLAIIIGILTAIVDETIQLSIPGRASQVSDMFLDTLGAVTGAWIGHLFAVKHK
jgi:VanZ family protein